MGETERVESDSFQRGRTTDHGWSGWGLLSTLKLRQGWQALNSKELIEALAFSEVERPTMGENKRSGSGSFQRSSNDANLRLAAGTVGLGPVKYAEVAPGMAGTKQ